VRYAKFGETATQPHSAIFGINIQQALKQKHLT